MRNVIATIVILAIGIPCAVAFKLFAHAVNATLGPRRS